jgi:hypothetical protein
MRGERSNESISFDKEALREVQGRKTQGRFVCHL